MSIFKNVQGKTEWESPSNIALVKYWGKYGIQLPRNTSLSLTLSEACTTTSVSYTAQETSSSEISISFRFEGKENQAFEEKIKKFLQSIVIHFPFLESFHLDIESSNSFPHSTGIASSASSMSALALCLCQMENDIYGGLRPHEFLEKASLIARLGSGSACRSVYPLAASWGKHPSIPFSSGEFATPFSDDLHPVFQDMKDSILIVSAEEKSVSSRAGHALMEDNPYASARYAQAEAHITELIASMKSGDLEKWGNIVEKEALTLHALMMASEPPFILMKPGTLSMIERIRAFRNEQKLPVYFTLDAGPNIHLLYPSDIEDRIKTFIEEELLSFCDNGRVIHDQVGRGPVKTA